jgi:hypothetical protein
LNIILDIECGFGNNLCTKGLHHDDDDDDDGDDDDGGDDDANNK